MGWRDDLVEHLVTTIRIVPARVPGVFTVSLSWPNRPIDLPSVCNHLARHFKIPSVTVVRRSPPDQLAATHTATLRISGADQVGIRELQREFGQRTRDLALAIVSSGT